VLRVIFLVGASLYVPFCSSPFQEHSLGSHKCRMLTQVHPVLIHIGAIYIPTYGVVAAIGVLAALFLAQHTGRVAGLDTTKVWNLCVVALFAALVGERLLLVAMNLRSLRHHPAWLLALAMVHHPLLAGAGVVMGLAAAGLFAQWQHLPLAATADVLAAPLALGLSLEQLGALMAGAGFGSDTAVPWAVTYSNQFAAIWSGAPLGVPLHPVQAYAALAFLTLAIFLLLWQRHAHQQGDLAGLFLMGAGVAVYITELWRDPEGRGSLLHGALNGPQLAAVAMVLAGAVLLREHKEYEAVHD
jgi:phosphatidylglycerol---prolipoprotein diacylglyceryl transferase